MACGSAVILPNEEKLDIQQLVFFIPDCIVNSLHLYISCPQLGELSPAGGTTVHCIDACGICSQFMQLHLQTVQSPSTQGVTHASCSRNAQFLKQKLQT